MHRRFLTILGLMAFVAAAAHAQPAPPAIDNLARLDQPLTSQQQQQVTRYVQFYIGLLGSDDPRDVGRARERLQSPLNAPGVTIRFRHAYASQLLPALQEIIGDREKYLGSMNAMQIAARLQTVEALELMVDHCDRNGVRPEQRAAIRIWAARGIKTILRDAGDLVLNAGDRTNATRALGRAVDAETDWRVVRRQLDAIASTKNVATGPTLEEAFETVVERMAKTTEASPMMAAIRPTIVGLRGRFLGADIGQAEKQRMGRVVAGHLGDVLDVVDKHWDSAHASRTFQRDYARAIDVVEAVLNLIDLNLGRTIGDTQLKDAFDAADRDAFQEQLSRVKLALARPPYQ